MDKSFDDPHLVLHDAATLFWVRPLEIDADGAPNAYHRDDPHGSKGLAIEYIGNGMTIFKDGQPLSFELAEADNKGWLSVYQHLIGNRWQPPQGYTVDIYGVAKDQLGRVCAKPDGRLISATSLVARPLAPYCEQNRYVNALRYPGIVVPNRASNEVPVVGQDDMVAPPFAKLGVHRGDLAIVYNPATERWQGAFVYDTGPRELLGEGSLRLALDLLNRKDVPKTAIETNSLGIEETFTVVFPRTVKKLGPRSNWTPQTIQKAAAKEFQKWGGGSISRAIRRLKECAEEYNSRRKL